LCSYKDYINSFSIFTLDEASHFYLKSKNILCKNLVKNKDNLKKAYKISENWYKKIKNKITYKV